jgi:uncharacterized membrane protein YdbT with pleckstrin-like domain
MMRRVAISPKLLNEGERVVLSTRTHVKVLLVPVLVLLVTVFVVAYLAAQAQKADDGGVRTTLQVLLGVAAVVIIWRFVAMPFVRWFTTTYTFTDRRFMQRSGLVAKEGRTIPLNRISGVDFEIGVVDRLFGCGTLVVSDASELGRVELRDVPKVEQVQRVVADELHRLTGSDRQRSDDGT